MKPKLTSIIFFLFVVIVSTTAMAQENYYFSAVQGKMSKKDSIILVAVHPKMIKAQISGEQAANFKLLSISKGSKENTGNTIVTFRFEPQAEANGISRASLKIKSKSKTLLEVGLKGMGIPALEGENEASLSSILDLLDFGTNVGWTTLPNHIQPELQGDEISAGLFQKANDGDVTMTPIARYSPPSIIPFGYYLSSPEGPELKRVGILADSENFHEHQALYPTLESGATSFDPKDETFGFYVVSHTHNSFSEDQWNMINFPDRAAHSVRIYPVKTKEGQLKENSYLVCYEEASNGDYQDYVFLVENIKPVQTKTLFTTILQPNDFTGWDTFLETKGLNNDPEKIFSVKDGVLKVVGEELGYVITQKSYKNYHMKLQFKWGDLKWPPRENEKRDSGVCYHIPESEENKIWPLSVECQIQEGDVGDFWLLDYSTIEVDGKQNEPKQYSNVVKSKDNELPNGEWNTLEILTFNGTCVHIVNGQVVNYGTNSSRKKGKILLQSEFAEIFYQNVVIREF
ncbi:DUF1080 domain-containing protein [Aurantibacter crassamenti]|uniref:3-keto-disaccharide hydrolase n=1 Tax=Aurantibacter crassamenti TaxID=1837375 RepID=UPI001939C176|nr:DUF1080 domain-containing protein [Aurantibacter crassamenti]MBM1107180.1 DUF1080 domain-containing protein [Aurantibacter crassamenti]